MIVSCSVQYGLLTCAYRHVVQEQPLLLLTEYSQGLWCGGISKPGPSAVGCWVVFLGLFVLKRGEPAPRWATWSTCQNREWKQPGTAVLTWLLHSSHRHLVMEKHDASLVLMLLTRVHRH